MRPLSGRVVATTRDGEPDDPLVEGLRSAGATVRVWPTLTFAPPRDGASLDWALRDLDAYDWVVFTSARGVRSVAARLDGPPGRLPRVAVVGPSTGAAASAEGWQVDVVGDGGGAAGLVAALEREGAGSGARVLFPAGSRARDELERGLLACGARVDRVDAYRTLPTPPDPARVREDLARGVDAVTFASPSAVHALDEALDHALPHALSATIPVAIGPTTARALEDAGLTTTVVASEATFDALVEACASLPFPD